MLKKITNKVRRLDRIPVLEILIKRAEIKTEQQTILLGRAMSIMNLTRTADIINNIHEAEYKVFSQWGDDGIIDFLVSYLNVKNKTFIEFGVEDYRESNTRFLLINRNWSGLVMDGSENNMEYVKNDNIYWRHDLKALSAFVTKENINDLIIQNKLSGEIGLLHIDIDGNDYWIWEALNEVDPVIVIVEYNSVFGPYNKWTIPYDSSFVRNKHHYSNLYYGASLPALCELASKKGFSFIGCNSNGNNAYFIRNNELKELKELSPEKGYVLSKFSESRDEDGKLTYLRGNDRLKEIEGMPIFNIETGQIEKITQKP